MHTLLKLNTLVFIFIFILLLNSHQTFAYRQPVSNQFMPPHCPLLASGAKDSACLYIPKSQCDYFVSKQGSNTNPGTETQPFATIQKGVDQLSAGDTLCIKGYGDGSSYAGGALINNKHGNESAWITIGGYESTQPVVNKGNNYTEGIIAVKNSSYIRIKGIENTKAGNGFTVETSDNIDLVNLKAHDNWGWGIGVPSNNGPSSRIRVEHSNIYNNQRRHYNNNGKGGVGAQFNNVNEGAFRYNMVYRNLNEGFDVHMDSNQIIVEQNFFSENNHTAFYVNHSSNVLYNRNLTICTGEKPLWTDQIVKHGETDNLGTAITFRNESSDNNAGRAYGGNHTIINNIVMGCTSHLIITPQVRLDAQGNPKPIRPMGSHLVAFNTFIDARKGGIGGEKEADFLQLKTDSSYYGEPVVFMNNLFKFDDTEGKLINQPSAANINTIIFASNLTDQAPGFSEGIIQTNLPFEQAYNHTTFLGDNPKPWELSKEQLDTILRRAKLTANSPAVNAGQTSLPSDIAPEFRNRFLNLYASYLAQDYFGNTRGNNPDIGAHEFDGVLGPTFTPTPTPTNNPNATNTPIPPTNSPTSEEKFPFFDNDSDTDWLDILLFVPKYLSNKVKFDLNNDGTVDVFDFTTSINWFNHSSDTPIPTNEPTPTTGQIPTNNPTPTQETAPTDGPTPTSPPPTPTPPNIPGEIRLLEWNKPAEISHSGFLEAKPAPDFAQGNWVTPTNYAEGKLYIRAKVNSIPINQPGMRLGLCFWQGESNTPSWGEECASAEKIEGRAENEVMWVREMSQLNPIGGNNNHIDWTTDRWKYGIIVRNGSGNGEGKPVTKKAGMNWNGEDPAHWYPMDIHFTIVIVKKGQTFSGWQNYGW